MADIFISYKKEDAGRVIRIVEGLRAEGFSVWWDHGISPGAQWDQTIQNELNAAKAVIAIWSKDSVGAPWVKEEAAVGKSRGILLPIRIDDVAPPLGFSLIQMGDLVGWDGDQNNAHWKLVLDALRAVIRGETPQGLEAPPRRRAGLPAWAFALVLLALLGAAGVVAFTYLNQPPPQVADASPQAPAPAGAQTPPPTGVASATEQAAWDQATDAKTRQAFQSYLVAYPNGAFAQRARDVLLTCRTENRETWTEQRTGQILRGVNAELAPTQAGACAIARRVANENWDRTCRAMSANNPANARNTRTSSIEAACDCRETPGGWYCLTDPSFTCTWEMRSEQPSEICGG